MTGIVHTLGALFTCSTDRTAKVLEPSANPGLISNLTDLKSELTGVSLSSLFNQDPNFYILIFQTFHDSKSLIMQLNQFYSYLLKLMIILIFTPYVPKVPQKVLSNRKHCENDISNTNIQHHCSTSMFSFIIVILCFTSKVYINSGHSSQTSLYDFYFRCLWTMFDIGITFIP